MPEVSKKFGLNKTEQGKMWSSFLLSMGGFVAVKIIEQLLQVDFGGLTPLVAALAPFLINAIRLWLRERGIEPLAGKDKK